MIVMMILIVMMMMMMIVMSMMMVIVMSMMMVIVMSMMMVIVMSMMMVIVMMVMMIVMSMIMMTVIMMMRIMMMILKLWTAVVCTTEIYLPAVVCDKLAFPARKPTDRALSLRSTDAESTRANTTPASRRQWQTTWLGHCGLSVTPATDTKVGAAVLIPPAPYLTSIAPINIYIAATSAAVSHH